MGPEVENSENSKFNIKPVFTDGDDILLQTLMSTVHNRDSAFGGKAMPAPKRILLNSTHQFFPPAHTVCS